MDRHRSPRAGRRTVATLLATFVALTLGLGVPSPAAGGGWAVGSLDALPDAVAGRTVDVGFTILQHGVTPRQSDEMGGDVGIEIVSADGTAEFFRATPTARAGHHVAAVTFPAEGEYTWHIRMGWFGPQELGTLRIAAADSTAISGADAWNVARWGVLGVAVALGLVAVDPLRARRRSASPA